MLAEQALLAPEPLLQPQEVILTLEGGCCEMRVQCRGQEDDVKASLVHLFWLAGVSFLQEFIYFPRQWEGSFRRKFLESIHQER